MSRCVQLAAEEPEGLLSESFPLIDDFLCRALRGEPVPWGALADLSPDEFLSRCHHHGVSALLYHSMHAHHSWRDWSPEVRQALEHASRAGVAQDLLAAHYLKELIQVFAERDIPCLLLKGEALAASLYPGPGTRTRSDSDLFIPICDISKVRDSVLELGYTIVSPVYKSRQFTVMRPGDRTGNVRFDIHWRISNAPRFARVLSFEAAYVESIEVPAMAPARMLCNIDSLMLACMHRQGSERHDRDRLIWLHDIHALTAAMNEAELLLFARKAVERRTQGVCLDGLMRAEECFASGLPDEVLTVLRSPTSGKWQSAQLADHSSMGLLLDDWKQLAGGRERIGLLRELLLPSGQSLLNKYNKTNRLWLPLLYLRRMVGGVRDRLSTR